MSIRMDNNRLQQLELSKLKLPQVEPEDSNETPASPAALTTSDYEPVTASAMNIIEQNMRYRVSGQRGARYTSIASGVYQIPEGRVVVYNNQDGKIGIQVCGEKITNWDNILVQLKELTPTNTLSTSTVSGSTTPNSVTGVNGEIDEAVAQGRTGDCWILTAILSLTATEEGRDLIKNSMEIHDNGDVTITFKGVTIDGEPVKITVKSYEIMYHDTDDIRNEFSDGDNDMLVFELAVEKLLEQYPDIRDELGFNDEDKLNQGNPIADGYITQGGFPKYLFAMLGGNVGYTSINVLATFDDFLAQQDDVAEMVTVPNTVAGWAGKKLPRPNNMTEKQMYNSSKTYFSNEYVDWYNEKYNRLHEKGFDEEVTLNLLQQIYELQPCAVTFGIYGITGETKRDIKCLDGNTFNFFYEGSPEEEGELWGHALAITGMTEDTVTFVNPWDSSVTYTVTWEEFAKIGIGSFDVNVLETKEEVEEEQEPIVETPSVEVSDKSAKQILGEITTYVFCGGLEKDLKTEGITDIKDFLSIKGEIVNHFTDIGDEICKIGDIKTAVKEKFYELSGMTVSTSGGGSVQKTSPQTQSVLNAQVLNTSVLSNSVTLRTVAAEPIVIESGKDFNSVNELKTYLSDQADEIKKTIADSYGIVFSPNNKSRLSYDNIANSIVQKHKTDFRQVTKQQIKEEMVAEYNKRHDNQAILGQQIAMQNLQIISQVKAHIIK